MYLIGMTAVTQEAMWGAIIALILAIAAFLRGENTRRTAKGASAKAQVAEAKADYLLNGGGDKKIDDRLVSHGVINPPEPRDPEPEEKTEIGQLRADIQQLVNYWRAREEREDADKVKGP